MSDKRSILVIEDENSLRLLLSSFLSKHYAVESRKDGLDALTWMSKGNIPEAIVLDMEMPRLSGAEFLIHIRSSGYFKDIPVLVVSGNSSKELPNNLKTLGANAFMSKPVNPTQIRETIDKLLVSSLEFVTI